MAQTATVRGVKRRAVGRWIVKPKSAKPEKIPFERISRDYLGIFYVAVPQWPFDVVLADPAFPDSFLRFFLNLWRATVGWQQAEATLSARDLTRRSQDASRYSQAMAAAGLIEYTPGKKGRSKSVYKILPTFGNPRIVNAFLSGLRDALNDERAEFEGDGERLSADRFAVLVKRKMDAFLKVVEKIGEGFDGNLSETDFAKDAHLSVSSLEAAHRVARKDAGEGGEWYRNAA